MIQVKTFVIENSNNPLHHERLDGIINKFLAENDIEVIDIKYSTAMAMEQTRAAIHWKPSALLIYKTKERETGFTFA